MSAIKSKNRNGLRDYSCLILLFVINLLNYMDRLTVAGVLTQVQTFFSIDDTGGGLLQTVFIVFYMIVAPLCGFLGDRYNRKWIIIIGIACWILAVLASSFVPANLFWLFLLFRGIVGIGEASYATIAPTIIADIFSVSVRNRAIMFFYFATPIGSGLGYMVSSKVSSLMGSWQWGLRVTPLFGAFCILLLILIMKEPKRGEAEEVMNADKQSTTYWEDIKALFKIPTYVNATIAYTSVIFATGTLSWWGPAAVEHSTAMREHLNNTHQLSNEQKNNISFTFGIITVIGGILGVYAGSTLSEFWSHGKWCCKPLKTVRSDALVCAVGSLLAIPFLFVGLHLCATNISLAWVFIFLTVVSLSSNWAIIIDLLLDIIVPQRRSVANSWQILISHLFGDASGPYIIGMASDWIRGSDTSPSANFQSLIKAFYIPNVILIVSVVLFIAAAVTFVRDRNIFLEQIGYYSKGGGLSNQFNGKEPNNGKVYQQHEMFARIGNGAVNDRFY
uniref:Major facilitator superfamily (MFS) profile domain-containing protein n=1 Tax=Setaria digitata TaxID=48799 RepID=A0A915PBV9_9BILA